ncbi:hypothetical protein CDAR_299931 [Caerostris darwini]|uniref:Uncharacterized protein n=1 Tax=Caerostris darwini TaxID=1538125 RepID=A0AAV4W2Z4_9ARAC|nr:hypothetical protein CDAR_299931 [Caerostris darwini]
MGFRFHLKEINELNLSQINSRRETETGLSEKTELLLSRYSYQQQRMKNGVSSEESHKKPLKYLLNNELRKLCKILKPISLINYRKEGIVGV